MYLFNMIVNHILFRIIFLTSSIIALLIFGVFGIGFHVKESCDLRVLFTFGQVWLDGLNAYNPQDIEKYTIGQAYPPQATSLFVFLALFPWQIVEYLMKILNIVCIGIIAFFSLKLLKQAKVENINTARWFIPALIMFTPFLSSVLWHGQTSLIITAALIGSWYFSRVDRWILAGILLTIAGIKPHLSLLIALWFLLEKQWKLLAVAIVAFFLFSLIPLIKFGPIDMFVEWILSTNQYPSKNYNTLGSIYIFGIPSLFYQLGIKSKLFLIGGILLTGLLWRYRSKFSSHDILGLLLAMTALFGFLHSYDLVLLTPLIAIFWIHLYDKTINKKIIIALSLMFLMFLPRSVLIYNFSDIINFSLLWHYRTLLFLGIAIWLLVMSLKSKPKLQN